MAALPLRRSRHDNLQRLLLQVRVLDLELILLAPEVEVEDDLLLQILDHLVTDLVCLLNPLRDGGVASLEVIKSCHLALQIVLVKYVLVRVWTVHIFL